MYLRIEQQRTLPFHHAVAVKGRAVIVWLRQGLIGCLSRGGAQIAGNGAELFILGQFRLPFGRVFQRIVQKVVIGIHRKEQFSRRQLQTVVNGPAFSAVFLIRIADRKRVFLRLPFSDQLPGAVEGAVIHDEPLKIAEGLFL